MVTRAWRARTRNVGLVFAVVLVVLAVPPVLFGLLSYWKLDFVKVSYYAPYEELLAALRTGSPMAIAAAPLVSVNMTSGLELANMFTLSVGQLLLSVALGIVGGLLVVTQLALRRTCQVDAARTASAVGTGLAATVAASGTGILGCCGPALSGGMLALLGVGAGTAHMVAHVSPAVQVAVIALFAVSYVRLRRRVRRGATRLLLEDRRGAS